MNTSFIEEELKKISWIRGLPTLTELKSNFKHSINIINEFMGILGMEYFWIGSKHVDEHYFKLYIKERKIYVNENREF